MDILNADFDSVWKQAIERYWTDFTVLFLLEEWGSRPAPESQDQELAKCSRDGKLGLFRVDKLLCARRGWPAMPVAYRNPLWKGEMIWLGNIYGKNGQSSEEWHAARRGEKQSA